MTHQNPVMMTRTMTKTASNCNMTDKQLSQIDKQSPLIELKLQRFPLTNDSSLKAWNAADEYLFDWLKEQNLPFASNTLIINDQFGALSCGLNSYQPYCWNDSFLSRTAIQTNIKLNSLSSKPIFIDQCEHFIPEYLVFDLVVIRIPKHNSLLEFQLHTIKKHLHKNTIIVSAGMSKEIHKSNLKIYELIIGETKTSLAKKKARLIFTKVQNLSPNERAFNALVSQYKEERFGIKVTGLAGVFSRNKLDIGSRILLNYMPKTQAKQKLIDLGCGTGVLGTCAAIINSELEVTFTDESWLAVESAKRTFKNNCTSEANYLVTNVLEGLENNHYNYILCNPPFHQQSVQTLAIANEMFKQASEKLVSSGELRVVANRHLNYNNYLTRYFSQVKIISKDPKFIIWLAKSPKR